jgi:CheY-like chemotaxis protein/anti-sigma regulatory factor (Ser/Thr protein kinase)
VTVPFGRPDSTDAPATPVGPSEVARGTAEAWEQDVAPLLEAAVHPGAPAGVLVVDDNADMRTYLTRLLAPLWTVRTVANGEEALASVDRERPDVVLTDVMMPRVDGFELLRRLRADPATSAIPVIMLTARAGQEAAVEGFAAGVDDYLAKPFQAAELIARVRAVVERAARRAASGHTRDAPTPADPALPADPATTPVAALPPVAEAPPGAGRAGAPADVRTLVPAGRTPETAPAPSPPPSVPPASPPPVTRHRERWRFPATAHAIPALRRALRRLLGGAGVEDDLAYDLLLAACEAATNAIEHAQDPTEPFFDVTAEVVQGRVEIGVRDYGQWRQRVPSMDRGRGSTLMSAFADITATPSPEGTTVVIRAPRTGQTSPEPGAGH